MIGKRGNEKAQPKTVAAYVELQKAGREAYTALYDNCYAKEKHAEDFMWEDDELIKELKKMRANPVGGLCEGYEGLSFEKSKERGGLFYTAGARQTGGQCEGRSGRPGSPRKEDREKPKLVVYLTLQPCHYSVKNTPDKSCCETLIKFKKEHLDPSGTKLVIKPTFLLMVREKRSDTSLHDMIQ